MKPLFKDSLPLISEQEIQQTEAQLKIMFPQSYREFLLSINGGFPEPNGFNVNKGDPNFIDYFYGINLDGKQLTLNLVNEIKDFRGIEAPDNYIPIAGNDSGDKYCLSILGEDLGSVYFWEHDNYYYDPDEPDECFGELKFITNDFEKLIEDAIYFPHESFFETLLRNKETEKLKDMIINEKLNINARDYKQATLLELAIEYNNVEIANLLLQKNCPSETNNLFYAKTPEMVNLLIKYGASVNQIFDYTTPLMTAAATHYNLELVEFLLKNGADSSIKDENGKTALDLANEELKTLLLEPKYNDRRIKILNKVIFVLDSVER